MRQVVRARDFGDFAEAVAACGPGARLVLDPGDYPVGSTVVIDDAHGLDVEAAGARLVVGDPQAGGLWVRGGSGVRVHGLEVDFDPAPFAQGTVVGVDAAAGTFVVTLDEGSLPLGHPAFIYDWDVLHPSQFGSFFDPAERRLKRGQWDHVFLRRAAALDGSRWEVEVAAKEYGPSPAERLAGIEAGDRFVHAARFSGCGVALFGVEGARLEDVWVRAAASHAILAQGCGDVTLVDCGVAFASRGPGADRLVTSDGDGFHYKDGHGFSRVEGGLFEGMLDDGFNNNATPFVVRGVVADGVLALSGGAGLAPGDRLLVQCPATGVVRGVAEVASVVGVGGRVRLASALACEAGDLAVNLSHSGTGFRIVGTTYRWHRGIAMRPRNGPGHVEGVTVVGTGSHGLLAVNDPDWPEGPIPHDLTVVDNRFEATGHTNGTEAVRIAGIKRGGGPAEQPCVERVTVGGNTFVDLAGAALYLGGCRDVLVEGNRFGGADVVVEACEQVSRR
jgi:hypothetical protein